MPALRRVCVFCGSREGGRPAYRRAATALGQALAARDLGLVYGGAQGGLMGAVADAVLAGGQRVHGVVPHGLAGREFAHPRLSEAHFVESMHERKAVMEQLCDAFIALPGGYGTLDELFEALSWAQLGLHAKPIGLLNVSGYFDPLVAWVARGVDDGFVAPEHAALLLVERRPEPLVERLLSATPVEGTRWRRPPSTPQP